MVWGGSASKGVRVVVGTCCTSNVGEGVGVVVMVMVMIACVITVVCGSSSYSLDLVRSSSRFSDMVLCECLATVVGGHG